MYTDAFKNTCPPNSSDDFRNNDYQFNSANNMRSAIEHLPSKFLPVPFIPFWQASLLIVFFQFKRRGIGERQDHLARKTFAHAEREYAVT
jgi:hypothetical protein